MQQKSKLLVLADWFTPAYKAGGPIRSIHNLVAELTFKFNIYIITRNTDIDGTVLENVESNKWQVLNKLNVYYFDPQTANSSLKQIMSLIEYDSLYLNSLFSYPFSIKILVQAYFSSNKKNIVLAPRGELSTGALGLKSTKKKLFLLISKVLNVHKNIIWHATSLNEIEDIKSVFGQNTVATFIPNLPTKLDIRKKQHAVQKKESSNLKLIFFSRISKMKNLNYLLSTLSKLEFEGEIKLDIYGTIEDSKYWDDCINIAKTLPANIDWEYKGILIHNQIVDVLPHYHLFCLPTLGENFGHAIIEAMQCGCPVLISNRTPWKNLKTQQVGWDIDLRDPEAFKSAILEALHWNVSDMKNYSNNAMSYAKEIINNASINKDYVILFSNK
jgi:glycosyltransferase involved in cell wall biosynthesis